MKNKIPLFALLLIGSLFASDWQNNFNNCPQTYQSQTCPSPTLVCGYSGGITYCADPSAITAPGSTATSNTDWDSGSLNGGYIIDCQAFDGVAPHCNNGGSFWCDRNSTCYSTKVRDTTCTASVFGQSTCGSCRSGYGDCSGGDVCETQFGVTSCSAGANNNVPSCGNCVCNSGYLDCDSSGAGAGDGCEIHDGFACSGGANSHYNGCSAGAGNCVCNSGFHDCDASGAGVGDGCEIQDGAVCYVGSIPGVYNGCSGSVGLCEITPQHFITNTLANASSSSPLLWGQQYGGGLLLNLSNASNASFTINATGCMRFMDGTTQCTAGGGSGGISSVQSLDAYIVAANGSVSNFSWNTTAGDLRYLNASWIALVMGNSSILRVGSVNNLSLSNFSAGLGLIYNSTTGQFRFNDTWGNATYYLQGSLNNLSLSQVVASIGNYSAENSTIVKRNGSNIISNAQLLCNNITGATSNLCTITDTNSGGTVTSTGLANTYVPFATNSTNIAGDPYFTFDNTTKKMAIQTVAGGNATLLLLRNMLAGNSSSIIQFDTQESGGSAVSHMAASIQGGYHFSDITSPKGQLIFKLRNGLDTESTVMLMNVYPGAPQIIIPGSTGNTSRYDALTTTLVARGGNIYTDTGIIFPDLTQQTTAAVNPPSQAGHTGEFLQTTGASTQWARIDLGNALSVTGANTTNIAEGTNLYFTGARVVAAVGNFSAENTSIWGNISNKLNISDQRYNESARVDAINSTTQALLTSNTTTNSRIDSLNSTKLDASDQRYNDTAAINSLNSTKITLSNLSATAPWLSYNASSGAFGWNETKGNATYYLVSNPNGYTHYTATNATADLNESTIARIGSCPSGFVTATTTDGVTCAAVVHNITGIGKAPVSDEQYLAMWSNITHLNQSNSNTWGARYNTTKGALKSTYFTGGTSSTATPVYLDLGAVSGKQYPQIVYADGSVSRFAFDTTPYGTNSIFWQGFPATTSQKLVLEAWNAAEFAIGTGSTAAPITFWIDRTQKVDLTSSLLYSRVAMETTENMTVGKNLSVAGTTWLKTLNVTNLVGNISNATFPASTATCAAGTVAQNVSLGTTGLITTQCITESTGGGGNVSGTNAANTYVPFFINGQNISGNQNFTFNATSRSLFVNGTVNATNITATSSVRTANLLGSGGSNFFTNSCTYGVSSYSQSGAATCAAQQGTVTGSGTATNFAIWTGSTTIGSDSNLLYSQTYNEMTVGTNTHSSFTYDGYQADLRRGVQKLATTKDTTLNNINQETSQREVVTDGSGTWTTIITHTLDTSSYAGYLFKVDLNFATNKPNYGNIVFYCSAYDEAGAGANIVGSSGIYMQTTTGSPNAQCVGSGNDVLIQVVDASDGARTYWHATYTVMQTNKEIP